MRYYSNFFIEFRNVKMVKVKVKMIFVICQQNFIFISFPEIHPGVRFRSNIKKHIRKKIKLN